MLRAERCILDNSSPWRAPTTGSPRRSTSAARSPTRPARACRPRASPRWRSTPCWRSRPTRRSPPPRCARSSGRSPDAPTHPDLREAAAALRHRAGDHDAAEAHVLVALEQHPERPRRTRSSARRAAVAEISPARKRRLIWGLARCPLEPVVADRARRPGPRARRARRGAGALLRGPGAGAGAPRRALVAPRDGARSSDPALLEGHAFRACAVEGVPVDVLRRTLRLYGGLASGSAPRAAAERLRRLRRLAERVVRDGPDPWAELTLARAELELGLDESARAHLSRVEASAPDSALAAEAARASRSITL